MKKFKIIIIIYLLLVCGCVTMPMQSDYTGPAARPQELLEEYKCENVGTDMWDIVDTKEILGKYTIHEIISPSYCNVLSPHNISFDYYKPDKPGIYPVVLVLPILGGPNTIAKITATYLTLNGYACIIVNRQAGYTDFDNLEEIDATLRQIVLDHKQVIDWIELREELDPNRIGVFGVSMGGIKASLISGIDSRVKVSVIALAGGDIPYILSYSREDGIEKERNKFLTDFNINQGALYKLLQNFITCDPLKYAQYIDARDTLMVLARFDRDVPYEKGKELKDAIGGPETIIILSDHLTALPFIFHIEKEALKFFDKKL